MALCDGLLVAWGKGVRWLECEVDSLDLVKAMNDTNLGRFVPKIAQVQRMLRWQWKVSLHGIHRDSNRVADYLTKSPCVALGRRVLEALCHELQVLLLRDSIRVLLFYCLCLAFRCIEEKKC